MNLDMLVRRVCKIKKDVYAPHGYWKDLLNIVALAATNELSPHNRPASFLHAGRLPRQGSDGKVKVKRTRDEIAATEAQKMAEARERRAAKNARLHATLLQQLENPRFRALYVAVTRLFAQQLVEDMRLAKQAEVMEDGPERYAVLYQISLAGKWAPSPGKAHDRVTNLASAISSLLYHSFSTGPSLSLSRDTPASHIDTHILRSFLNRHVLIPLRKIALSPSCRRIAGRKSPTTTFPRFACNRISYISGNTTQRASSSISRTRRAGSKRSAVRRSCITS